MANDDTLLCGPWPIDCACTHITGVYQKAHTAGGEGQSKSAWFGPPLQDLGAWTLLGEYCGVWDRTDALDRRIAEEPLGLGTLRQDRVVELGYTSSDARPGVDKGRCSQSAVPPLLADGPLLALCGHARRWAALQGCDR